MQKNTEPIDHVSCRNQPHNHKGQCCADMMNGILSVIMNVNKIFSTCYFWQSQDQTKDSLKPSLTPNPNPSWSQKPCTHKHNSPPQVRSVSTSWPETLLVARFPPWSTSSPRRSETSASRNRWTCSPETQDTGLDTHCLQDEPGQWGNSELTKFLCMSSILFLTLTIMLSNIPEGFLVTSCAAERNKEQRIGAVTGSRWRSGINISS